MVSELRGRGKMGLPGAYIARVARTDLGLRIAHIDHTNWDTHEGQQGRFSNLTAQLSRGLAAFYADLSSANKAFRIIVMTEFGRRLRSNLSQGTDHGHGSVMLVLGSDIQGGKMLGNWPGLEATALDRGVDVAVTTDHRQVISELLHLDRARQSIVFPGLQPGNTIGISFNVQNKNSTGSVIQFGSSLAKF